MNNTQRDFNTVSKVILGLSIFPVIMAITNSFISISNNKYFDVNNSSLVIEIICDCLILAAVVLTFMKKKYGLIALTVLFIVRMFATIPTGGNISYSYQLGGNMVLLLRDFGLFAIAMCFKSKRTHMSGWKSMLASAKSMSNELPKNDEVEKEGTNSNELEKEEKEWLPLLQRCEDLECIQPGEDNGNSQSGINNNDLEPEKQFEDQADISEEKVPISNVHEDSKQKHKVPNSVRQLFSGVDKKKITKTIILSVVGIGILAFAIVVLSKDYPKNINGFGDKIKYVVSLPNNRLSREYFVKYQKARELGLENLCKEYLTTSWDANPNDEVILDSLSSACFSLGRDSKDDEEYYDMAAAICRKMIKRNPTNKVAKERLALIYYNLTSSHFTDYYIKLAYKIVEELLMEDPQNGVGIVLMCRKYYSSEDWDDLLMWGKKGYELGKEKTSFWTEMTYYYSKGLYETGHRFNAMKYYSEAEESDASSRLHEDFIKIGGIPCSISSVKIQNATYDGKVIHKAGATIYDDNTRFLRPVIKLKANRTGRFYFDVKLYRNGKLTTGKNSPDGYSYRHDLFLWESDKEITTKLGGWGTDSPGRWESGGYRIEIWWEGERLYTYSFNIYSGFWHRNGYGNRFD